MRILLIALTFALSSLPALAQMAFPGPSQIREINTGWNSEQFRIVTVDPVQNPAKCLSPDGYMAASTQPGYNTHYAAALSAFLGSKPVTLAVDATACTNDRPRVIGIYMQK